MEHGSILNGNIRPRRVSSQWQSTQQDFALKQAEIQAKYAAQVDIARIQMEQARQRNDVDFAIQTQQSMQAAAERQQQAQQQQEQIAQAQLAQQMQAQQMQAQQMPPQAPQF